MNDTINQYLLQQKDMLKGNRFMINGEKMESKFLEDLNRKYGEELKKFGFVFDRIEHIGYNTDELHEGYFELHYYISNKLIDYEGGHLEIYADNKKNKITDIDLEVRTPKYYHITEIKSMSNLLGVLKRIKLEHDTGEQY